MKTPLQKLVKTAFVCLTILSISKQSHAQIAGDASYFQEALRFGQSFFQGNARYQALGGATTSIGADGGANVVNPAGSAMMRRSEMTLVPSIYVSNSTADFSGNSPITDSKSNLHFQNFSLSFVNNQDQKESGVLASTFTIGLNRLNNFHDRFRMKAVNDFVGQDQFGNQVGSTLTDYFLDLARGRYSVTDLDNELSTGIVSLPGLAYATYIINPDESADPDPYNYGSFIEILPTSQDIKITTKGAQYEWNFAYSANFNDKIYIGAALGIQTLRYERSTTFDESSTTNATALNTIKFSNDLKVRGSGANLTIGAIYKATDQLRLGASFKTPTLYRLTEIYEAGLEVFYNANPYFDNNPTQHAARTELLTGRYSYRSPMRINTGASYVIGKQGFITADLEIVPYNTARMNNPDFVYSFAQDNYDVEQYYKTGFNFKIGAEKRLDNIRLRGGVARYSNPYADEQFQGRHTLFVTGGLGARKDDFYFDAAAVFNTNKFSYTPYTLKTGFEPRSEVLINRIQAVFTIGFLL